LSNQGLFYFSKPLQAVVDECVFAHQFSSLSSRT